ncbi:hypothetical protein L9F63_019455, partial [Diploptera punctata]
ILANTDRQERSILMDYPSWLLADSDDPKITFEEESLKTRKITPKSVFIAPAFSGSSPSPDCPLGYKADANGKCIKLVQLNRPAQLDFLLQRLNAMYSTLPTIENDENDESSDSDSGPLHITIPLDVSEDPIEKETDEAIEVAIVMADVFKKEDRLKKIKEKPETIFAIWKTGENGTELEDVETASELEMEAANTGVKKSNMTAPVPDDTKYDVVAENSSSIVPDKRIPTLDIGKPSPDSPAEISSKNKTVTTDGPPEFVDSVMDLFEEMSQVIIESRIGNKSRRNVSSRIDPREKETDQAIEEAIVMADIFKEEDRLKNIKEKPETIWKTGENEESLPTNEKSIVKKILGQPSNTAQMEDQKANEAVRFPTQPMTSHIRFPSNHGGEHQPVYPSNLQQMSTLWWLPPGWRVDLSRHQPMQFSLSARMPLTRDAYHNNNPLNSYLNMDVDHHP